MSDHTDGDIGRTTVPAPPDVPCVPYAKFTVPIWKAVRGVTLLLDRATRGARAVETHQDHPWGLYGSEAREIGRLFRWMKTQSRSTVQVFR